VPLPCGLSEGNGPVWITRPCDNLFAGVDLKNACINLDVYTRTNVVSFFTCKLRFWICHTSLYCVLMHEYCYFLKFDEGGL